LLCSMRKRHRRRILSPLIAASVVVAQETKKKANEGDGTAASYLRPVLPSIQIENKQVTDFTAVPTCTAHS
jgi:hypothetical protein